ncbi:MAG TPA: alcohol dehydrogenase catalytic domain-containing protein [Verrucomicrobiae bacterium]
MAPLEKDSVLIEPKRVGICGSDVSFFIGHRAPPAYPLVLGHEVVGHVAAAGDDVGTLKVGQRVVVEPNYPCGVCSYCRDGRSNICINKKILGMTVPGCFAKQVVAPAEFVWPIPDSISDEDAVTIEPLTVSLHALWQSGAQIGDTVAVIGCGSTGLLLVQSAIAQGMRVLAHDKFENKLEMARRFGAQVDPNPEIPELWRDAGVTTVFECAGASSTVELALKAVPRGGQVVLLGLSSVEVSFTPLKFVREEIRVSGSIIYNHPTDFARAIALVGRGILAPGRIVSDTLPFAETGHALEIASTGEAGKVLLDMMT